MRVHELNVHKLTLAIGVLPRLDLLLLGHACLDLPLKGVGVQCSYWRVVLFVRAVQHF